MSEQKRTPWFPASVKPVRTGIYEVYRPCFEGEGDVDPRHRLKWDGERWLYCEPVGIAVDGDGASMSPTYDMWRGLQGDAHSLEIGASTYLVEFSEPPDRPGDKE